ncbi:hypothetical protein GGH95_004716 [Coemansia sp. RSA 1836]|nr:hypothetical protein GGH95_004716 [Coemansia sp. RSA 1836]
MEPAASLLRPAPPPAVPLLLAGDEGPLLLPREVESALAKKSGVAAAAEPGESPRPAADVVCVWWAADR